MTIKKSKIEKMTSKKERNIYKIADIAFSSRTKEELLTDIGSSVRTGSRFLVVTPNPEFVVYAQTHPWFKAVLDRADISLPDGMGVVRASRFLGEAGGSKIKERIAGVDFMADLCQLAAERDWPVYFLGGTGAVASKALLKLKKRFLNLRGWAEPGPELRLGEDGKITPEIRVEKIVAKILRRKSKFLFVGFGMGKQEKFLADNWEKLGVSLGMGVGGAFDYLSGEVKRAPIALRGLGLEWLYRLIHEPWRWRRQLALVRFVGIVVREKLGI